MMYKIGGKIKKNASTNFGTNFSKFNKIWHHNRTSVIINIFCSTPYKCSRVNSGNGVAKVLRSISVINTFPILPLRIDTSDLEVAHFMAVGYFPSKSEHRI